MDRLEGRFHSLAHPEGLTRSVQLVLGAGFVAVNAAAYGSILVSRRSGE